MLAYDYSRKRSKKQINQCLQELLDWMLEDESRVFFNEYLIRKGCNPLDVEKWRETGESASACIDCIKTLQEERLALGKGVKNPALAIFGLKNVAKWTDKAETQVTGKNGENLEIEIVSYAGLPEGRKRLDK